MSHIDEKSINPRVDSVAANDSPLVLHARTVTGTGGGPEKTILNSPRFLKPLGYRSECLFLRPPGDVGFKVLRERAIKSHAPLIEIDDSGRFSLRTLRNVINTVRQRNVNIWHAHDYKSNLLGILVKRFHSMKLVTTAHGWVNFDGMTPIYYWLDKRFFLPRYEKTICVSSTVMEQAVAGGTPASNCVLLDNAIDPGQFLRRRTITEAKAQDFGLRDNQILIGSIGRLSHEKGFDLLIDAVTTLIKNGLDAKLVIAGEGPEKFRLQEQIGRLHMNDRIQLYGFCKDTRSFYESLDLFVLSSHREGLPNVVLEAMAVGATVIATCVDGVPKIITDNKDGVLIPAGSSDSILAAIQGLLRNEGSRERLRIQGIQTIKEKWSFSRRMEQMTEIYSSVL